MLDTVMVTQQPAIRDCELTPVDPRLVTVPDRRRGIGGSDAPAILGVSKWRTPLDIYLEKRGEGEPQPESPAMRWGTALEPVVRQAYADLTGETVRVPGLLVHPERLWMLAHVDGLTESGRLVEIKTARMADGWGEPGTDEIPDAYLIQVQHYLSVTAISVADVAVLIGGSDFRVYEVPADADLQGVIVAAEVDFWDRVQTGRPPDPVSLADAKPGDRRSHRGPPAAAGSHHAP
jgi:putative phage-type endonuclease